MSSGQKMVSPGWEGSRPGLSCIPATAMTSPSEVRKFGKRTCKPNSVVCGHSSRRRVAADTHQRPTRRFRQLLEPPCRIGPMRNRRLAHGPGFPPYLVLLRVGFTLPPALLPERCALTAPFHPYPGRGLAVQADLNESPVALRRGVAEAVSSLWHWPSSGLDA